mgnify:CR=1 FL=1
MEPDGPEPSVPLGNREGQPLRPASRHVGHPFDMGHSLIGDDGPYWEAVPGSAGSAQGSTQLFTDDEVPGHPLEIGGNGFQLADGVLQIGLALGGVFGLVRQEFDLAPGLAR